MTLRFRVGSKSDVGRARERNEDSMLVKEPLFAVADGMGGHRGGDVASAMTVEVLERADLPEETPLETLVERIKEANHAVLERGASDSSLRGMGTTLTALLTEADKAHVAHVGDSRAYLLRDGALQQLTEDHTLVQRMVREGRLSPEQARHHPQRSVVTRALGVDDEVAVEILTLDLHAGDRILLCSDGLTGMVEEDRIREILDSEPDPQRAAEQLVDEANDGGGDDNITVVVIEVVDDGESANGSGADGSGQAPTAVRTSPRSAAADTAAWVRPDALSGGTEDAEGAGDHRAPRKRTGIRWGRMAARLVVLVALLIAALIGVRAYVNHQWYVGASNGHVAVYHGIPAAPLGIHLSHVATETAIPAASAQRLQPYRDLDSGITADSREDAESIVNQIRQDLARTTATTGGA